VKQESLAAFRSENGKIELICDSKTALGDLHDFLLRVKGEIVERMIKAHKDEVAAAEAQKESTEEKEEETF
jgi:hypothetical protein